MDCAVAAALVLAVGWSYLATLLPGPGYSGDTCKLQFVGWVLGTPHTTGYPVWTLASYAFSHLFPAGSVAWRANLLSALFATASVLLMFFVLRRGLRVPRAAAAGTALAFASTKTWWSQAVVAEVYSLHGLCLIACIGLLMKWQETRSTLTLASAAVVVGLSLSNHMTTVVVLPAFVVFVLLVDRGLAVKRNLLAALPAVVVPLLMYLYPFWRTHSTGTTYLEMQTPDLETFLWYLRGAQFRDRIFAFSFDELVSERLVMAAQFLVDEIGFLGIGLTLVGVVFFCDLRRHVLLIGAALGMAGYALCYAIPDIAIYFIPCWMVAALYIGIAAARASDRFGRIGEIVSSLVVMALAVVLWCQNRSEVDLSRHTREADWARSVIAALPEESLIVAARYLDFEVLQYFHQTNQTQGRELNLLTPVLSPRMRAYVDEFVDRWSPPPLIRRQADAAPDPMDVRDYLAGVGELVLFEERRVVPGGLPVFVTGEERPRLMDDVGIVTEPVAEGLWRLSLSRDNEAPAGDL